MSIPPLPHSHQGHPSPQRSGYEPSAYESNNHVVNPYAVNPNAQAQYSQQQYAQPFGQQNAGFTAPQVPPMQPARPQRSREQNVSIALAGAGALIMLIGVGLLLAMAAREGILTPPIRVVGGFVLAAALAGGAHWVRPRPGGRVGSVALLGASAATAVFDVYAMTQLYNWLHPSVGLTVAFTLAGLAAWRAVSWNEQWLYTVVCAGVGFASVAVTDEVSTTLIGFLVVLQAAGLIVDVTKQWPSSAIARTAPVAWFALVWAAERMDVPFPDGSRGLAGLMVLVVIAALGMVGAFLAQHWQTAAANSASVALAGALTPLLFRLLIEENNTLQWSVALVAAVALGLAAFALKLTSSARTITGIAAAICALIALVHIEWGDWSATIWLVPAVVLYVLQIRTQRLDRRFDLFGSVAVIAGLLHEWSIVGPIALFYKSLIDDIAVMNALVGLLFAAVGALGLFAARGMGKIGNRQFTMVVGGTALLYGLILAAIVSMGRQESAFFGVHVGVTVLTVAAACAVLLLGLRYPAHLGASFVWGVVLLLCAFMKLMFFDLAYMTLLTRGLVFVLAGLLLMLAGTKYARVYAETKLKTQQDAPEPTPFMPSAPGMSTASVGAADSGVPGGVSAAQPVPGSWAPGPAQAEPSDHVSGANTSTNMTWRKRDQF